VTFDLVVATVGRTVELERFLASVDSQTYRDVRVLVVDQNDDDRIAPLLNDRAVRLRSPLGLSRARNAALPHLMGDAVAFPDDDCIYPPDLLEHVAARLEELDGVTGREPWWTTDAAELTRENLWNRAISFTIFLRRSIVERVGEFDEKLGLPESSGEEIDFLIRALDRGARIEYDPSIVVEHPRKDVDLAVVAGRDGESIGYLLRKHRYPATTVARMLVRPVGGAVLQPRRAGFHVATLRGRLRGYRSCVPV
jgi:glycosyltransferase involved in cell wall biosynthesis